MDFRSRRPRTGLLLGATFLAGIAAFPAAHWLAPQLGIQSALAQGTDRTADRADTYRWLTLFGDVFERVRAEYVDPVTDKDLVENAINGMLTGLDPHSSYMNAKAFRDMQVQTKGEFGGLGIEVTAGQRLHQGDQPDRRHAGLAGRHQGGRHHHRAGRQDGAGPVAAGRGRQDARRAELEDHADHQARGRRQADRGLACCGEIIHIQVVKQRMEPDDIGYVRLSQFTEQADAGIRSRRCKTLKQQAGGKLRALILDLRNNPGGLLDQAVAVSGDFVNQGEIVSTRAPPYRGRAALGRQGRRHARRRAAGGADQRRLGLVQRDRRRRAAGPPPRGAAGRRAASARARCRR